MSEPDQIQENTSQKKKRNWTPYLLILPATLYLMVFFAWPMFQALKLAVWDDEAALRLAATASQEESNYTGNLPQGTQVTVLEQQSNPILAEDLESDGGNILTETWFRVSGTSVDGAPVEGWTSESRVRVREEAENGTPIMGTVRKKLGADAEPNTSLYAEPVSTSEIIGALEPKVEVQISELATLEVWYKVSGILEDGAVVEGWAPSRYVQVYDDEVSGRIDRGNVGQMTLKYIQKMLNDRFFKTSLWTTLGLMVIIIPTQFILAIIMALVIQARLKGNLMILYIFSIPLGVADLAVGIVWFSIFTQFGLLNSVLQGLGFIDAPILFLTAETKQWIIVAIWLAEVWRATSIVMIIVVSGLQAIPGSVLEAAEVFGANLWRRIRYVILPMLKPSLQVALILRTILALQVFSVVIALSGGDVVTVLANETYRWYDEFRSTNVAAAYAGLILLLSMVSAVIYLRLIRTQEEMTA